MPDDSYDALLNDDRFCPVRVPQGGRGIINSPHPHLGRAPRPIPTYEQMETQRLRR